MGKTFYDLTCEELCDLMCGKPEDEIEEEEDDTRRGLEIQSQDQ